MAVTIAILLILAAFSSTSAAVAVNGESLFGCYKSIVSFGDSLTDTGNILAPGVHIAPPLSANPPYGRTFFHRPTGRFSDGRLVIDFIAQKLGLPLVKAYVTTANAEERRRSFRTGVNFAVVGATALDYKFYDKIGYHNPDTNVSLGVQFQWFKNFLSSIPDGRSYLESSLVVMGEIGGNDYNYPIQQGTSLDELQSLVPPIISYIGSTIQELIKLGAVTVLVPGLAPLGCLPLFLTQFQKPGSSHDHDPKTGCLNWLNTFSQYHNKLLQKELQRLRELHPRVNIIFADYYNAALRLYLYPDRFGFNSQVLRACCGGGGLYNFNASARCGLPEATCCDDLGSYVSWDGIHWTEAAYRLIAQGFVEGPYTHPRFATICPKLIREPGSYAAH